MWVLLKNKYIGFSTKLNFFCLYLIWLKRSHKGKKKIKYKEQAKNVQNIQLPCFLSYLKISLFDVDLFFWPFHVDSPKYPLTAIYCLHLYMKIYKKKKKYIYIFIYTYIYIYIYIFFINLARYVYFRKILYNLKYLNPLFQHSFQYMAVNSLDASKMPEKCLVYSSGFIS